MFFYIVQHLHSTAPYLRVQQLHSTAPYLPVPRAFTLLVIFLPYYDKIFTNMNNFLYTRIVNICRAIFRTPTLILYLR
jgi:hypothetical protein